MLAEAVAGPALQEEVEVVEEGTRRRVHAGEGTMGARGNSSDFVPQVVAVLKLPTCRGRLEIMRSCQCCNLNNNVVHDSADSDV